MSASATAADEGRRMRLGLLVRGDRGPDRARLSLGEWVGIADVAEGAGFDTLFVVEPSEVPADAAGRSGGHGGWQYEGFTVLGALATRTRRVRLGAVPGGGEQRSPAILARLVTAVDVISHGRALLADCDRADDGIPLDERLQASRAVLEDPEPTFHGRAVSIDGAVNRPSPVQPGGVPIVVFVGQPADHEHLRAAGRYADAVVIDGDEASWRDAAGTVLDEAGRVGRRPGSMGLLWRTELRSGFEDGQMLAGELATRVDAGATGCVVGVALGPATERDRAYERVAWAGRAFRPVLAPKT